MSLHFTLSLVLVCLAGGYLLLGAGIIAVKQTTGAAPVIGVLFVVIGIWVVGGAVEMFTSDFAVFSIGRTCHFVGTALLPIVVLVFFREFTQSQTSTGTLALLMVIPFLSILAAATNSQHELMWPMPFANEAGEFLTRPESWGPWFLFVHLPYSYLLITAAITTLIWHSSTVAQAHRRSLLLLVACCAVPLSATLAYDLGFGSNTISYVPFVFAAMFPVFVWLIFVEKIVDIKPLPYAAVFQDMQDPVIVVDDNRCVVGLNRGAERMLAIAEAVAFRQPLEKLFGDNWPRVFAALDTGKPQRLELPSGSVLHIQASAIQARRASDTDGQVLMFRDVSEVEKAQREIRENEVLLNTVIDHSANGIIRFRWVEDDRGEKRLRAIFANAAAGRFLDVDEKILLDIQARQVVRMATAGMKQNTAAEIVERFGSSISAGRSVDVDVKQRAQGEDRWLRMICEPVGTDYAMTLVETTDRKAKELQMETNATIDALTGVFNRRGFEASAAECLSGGGDDACGALLFIDLNGFKEINDEYGHEAGDEILRVAAKRLGTALRGDDIVGRPGGDEFVALVPDVDEVVAEELAVRLAEALSKRYIIGNLSLQCSASIGLALYPKNASTLTGLLREADQAMYRAKARSRDVDGASTNDLLEKAV